MIPRSVKRKQPQKQPITASPLPTPAPAPPLASTSRLPPPHTPQEVTRLGLILHRLEETLSDWALSTHKRNGLLDRISASQAAGEGGLVHLQHLLALPPIRALTSIQADLQKAVRLRESEVAELSEDGFKLGRKGEVDCARLGKLGAEDWDESIVYVENIPTPPIAHQLLPSLSALLRTTVQRIITPPLYNPNDPPQEAEQEQLAEGENDYPSLPSQSEAFAAPTAKEPRRGVPLPQSGGPFKGFAIIIVGSKEDVARITEEWKWEKEVKAEVEPEDGDASMSGGGREGKALEAAKQQGMRAIKYSRYLELKAEYLAYQRSLHALNRAHAAEREHAREARLNQQQQPNTQQPAHTNGKQSRRERQLAQQAAYREPPPERPSHRRSPSPPAAATDRKHPAPSSDAPTPAKKPRLSQTLGIHPPSTPDQPIQPSTLVPQSASESITARGGFPRGCVIWVRNVHEKSSKTTLRAVWAKVLEGIEEGSGKGVEFVDYDKGLDTCYIRFSSPHLSTLLLEHLAAKPHTHITPHKLYAPPSKSSANSDSSSESSSSDSEPDNLASLLAERRPIIATLLEGDRERVYWEQLPEAARKVARKSAGGGIELMVIAPGAGKKKQKTTKEREGKVVRKEAQPAGLAKAAREQEEVRRDMEKRRAEESAREESGRETETEGEAEGRKRKKPSKV